MVSVARHRGIIYWFGCALYKGKDSTDVVFPVDVLKGIIFSGKIDRGGYRKRLPWNIMAKGLIFCRYVLF